MQELQRIILLELQTDLEAFKVLITCEQQTQLARNVAERIYREGYRLQTSFDKGDSL